MPSVEGATRVMLLCKDQHGSFESIGVLKGAEHCQAKKRENPRSFVGTAGRRLGQAMHSAFHVGKAHQ